MRSFGQIFTGRLDCYGETIIKGEHKPGTKLTDYESRIKWGTLTDEHFSQHLDPARSYSLGIVPVDEHGMCSWMCLDYDDYSKGRDTGLEARAKLDALGLPLVPCFSKSLGVHLYAFFKHPVSVERARTFMEDCRDRMGLPENIEIFPKQDIISDPNMNGSFLNLPYWNGDERCAINADGTDMTFEDFLKTVYAVEMTDSDLDIVAAALDEVSESGVDFLHEAPPCVQELLEQGIPAGGRSNAMTQCAIFAKKREVDDFDWQSWVVDINAKHCFPPLSFDDISHVCTSVNRSTFGYLCKQQPMMGMCDNKLCRKRDYGILHGMERTADFAAFQIVGIKKVNASPPYYLVELAGYEDRPIKMTSTHLTTPKQFVQNVFEYLDVIFPMPKAQVLAEMVNEVSAQKGDKWTEEQAPEEMDDTMSILNALQDWILETVSPVSTLEEVQSNNPIWYKNKLIFKGISFIKHLHANYEKYPKKSIFEALKSKRAREEWFVDWGEFEAKPVTVEGQTVYVWSLPLDPEGWFTVPDEKEQF